MLKNFIKKIVPKELLDKLNKQKRDIEEFYKTGKRFRPHLPDFPQMVMIDTTTRCNLACNHCPHSVLAQDKKWLGDIDVSLYKKIIDEVAKENPNAKVRPFDGGEPLMRKDMAQLIKYAKNKGIKFVSINSNGHLMTSQRALEIIESGLDHIEFSVDATSAETYKKIRNSDQFDKLIGKLKYFIKLRNEKCPEMKVCVSFVKQKDNIHEEKAFKEFWKDLVDEISIREYHQHNGLVDEHGKYEGQSKEEINKLRPPCPYLWTRIIIQHDGSVRFCESDWKAEHKIGDIRNSTLKEIWHSKAYQELRESHIKGEFSHPFCKECTDWEFMNW